MRIRTTVTTVALVALGSAGCGGPGGPDPADPEAVVQAYMQSLYQCGDRGAGVRADLAYPESAAEDHRAEVAEEEQPGDCQEMEPKEFTIASIPNAEPGIPVAFEVSNEDCPTSEVPMIEADDRWLVNESEVDPDLLCTPYG